MTGGEERVQPFETRHPRSTVCLCRDGADVVDTGLERIRQSFCLGYGIRDLGHPVYVSENVCQRTRSQGDDLRARLHGSGCFHYFAVIHSTNLA